jgi:hypothetical protein
MKIIKIFEKARNTGLSGTYFISLTSSFLDYPEFKKIASIQTKPQQIQPQSLIITDWQAKP